MNKKVRLSKFHKMLFTFMTTATLVVGGAISAFAAETGTEKELVLASIVTEEMLSGAMDEIVGLLPVALPVAIGFMAIRKGLSWLFGVIKRA